MLCFLSGIFGLHHKIHCIALLGSSVIVEYFVYF